MELSNDAGRLRRDFLVPRQCNVSKVVSRFCKEAKIHVFECNHRFAIELKYFAIVWEMSLGRPQKYCNVIEVVKDKLPLEGSKDNINCAL